MVNTDQEPQNSEHAFVLESTYDLESDVGFLLRKASQRHMLIFSEHMTDGLTPTQFATLFRLVTEPDPISQNALGRLIVMDAATTKGVITRLKERGLITTQNSPHDKRRYLIHSTPKGQALIENAISAATNIAAETLKPLNASERETFLSLLAKMA